MVDLAVRIGQLMEQKGWSTYKLAAKAGIKDSTIYSLFDKNCNPTYKTLLALADAFEISLAELLSENIKDSDSYLVARKYDSLSDKSKEIIDFLFQKLD